MPDSPLVIPVEIAGRFLRVAGLAARVFATAGRSLDAAACSELQDVVDAALVANSRADVEVARDVATRAAELWEAAAELLAGNAEPARRVERTRLRMRARDLRARLDSPRAE